MDLTMTTEIASRRVFPVIGDETRTQYVLPLNLTVRSTSVFGASDAIMGIQNGDFPVSAHTPFVGMSTHSGQHRTGVREGNRNMEGKWSSRKKLFLALFHFPVETMDSDESVPSELNIKAKKPGPRRTKCIWCGSTECNHCRCTGQSGCNHRKGEMCPNARYKRRLVCNSCEKNKLKEKNHRSETMTSRRKRQKSQAKSGKKHTTPPPVASPPLEKEVAPAKEVPAAAPTAGEGMRVD